MSAAGAAYYFSAKSPPLIDPTDRRQVVLGERLYASTCASCHGASLEGQPDWRRRLPNGRLPAPPHDASGHTWHHSDADLIRVTKLGPAAYPAGHQTDMPAFEGALSDSEIAAVLAFIMSKWPEEIRARQARSNFATPR
ncbi:MAG: cytochrome c [Reyranella sp.]|nr:MAG: cytochrome c [Reyranella sp.]